MSLYREYDGHEEIDFLGAPRTRHDGKYRLSQRYRGPGDYRADVLGTSTTAGAVSRTDHVSTAVRP